MAVMSASSHIYNGITYSSCAEDSDGYYWCSVALSSSGEHQYGQWGRCSVSPSCLGQDLQCLTVGTAGVGAGHTCVFPFTYLGITYQTCAPGLAGLVQQPWCATSKSATGEMIQWGACSPTGQCMDEDKTMPQEEGADTAHVQTQHIADWNPTVAPDHPSSSNQGSSSFFGSTDVINPTVIIVAASAAILAVGVFLWRFASTRSFRYAQFEVVESCE